MPWGWIKTAGKTPHVAKNTQFMVDITGLFAGGHYKEAIQVALVGFRGHNT